MIRPTRRRSPSPAANGQIVQQQQQRTEIKIMTKKMSYNAARELCIAAANGDQTPSILSMSWIENGQSVLVTHTGVTFFHENGQNHHPRPAHTSPYFWMWQNMPQYLPVTVHVEFFDDRPVPFGC